MRPCLKNKKGKVAIFISSRRETASPLCVGKDPETSEPQEPQSRGITAPRLQMRPAFFFFFPLHQVKYVYVLPILTRSARTPHRSLPEMPLNPKVPLLRPLWLLACPRSTEEDGFPQLETRVTGEYHSCSKYHLLFSFM